MPSTERGISMRGPDAGEIGGCMVVAIVGESISLLRAADGPCGSTLKHAGHALCGRAVLQHAAHIDDCSQRRMFVWEEGVCMVAYAW
jgi:hypothetical protein